MLILARRAGEMLMIGDDIKIAVLGIKGNQVRLGIEAPPHIAVHRQEVYERLQAQADGDAADAPPDPPPKR